MSGVSIEFEFKSSEAKQWAVILQGLTRGETGARFQDRMDVFGESVADQLEAMLERWPGHYFEAEGYKRTKQSFWVEFEVASLDVERFAEDMTSLLQACQVEALTCSLVDMSSD